MKIQVLCLIGSLTLFGCARKEIAPKIQEPLSQLTQKAVDDMVASKSKLMRSCLKREGFDYIAPPANSSPILIQIFPPLDQQSLLDLEKNGYGLALTLERTRTVMKSKLAGIELLTGPDRQRYLDLESSCGEKVNRQLPTEPAKLMGQASQALDKYFADPEIKSVFRNWSSCMKSSGWKVNNYDDLLVLIRENEGNLETPGGSPFPSVELTNKQLSFEQKVARDDVHCIRPHMAVVSTKWAALQDGVVREIK
jgi:hypothetical protein